MYTLSKRTPTNGVTPFSLFEELFEAPAAGARWAPALDLAETDEALVVRVELPGVDPKQVEISLEDDRLEIKGEKVVERDEQTRGWYRVERRHGSFVRTIALPSAIDGTRVLAESRDGVLTITLPKREEAKARRIEIKTR